MQPRTKILLIALLFLLSIALIYTAQPLSVTNPDIAAMNITTPSSIATNQKQGINISVDANPINITGGWTVNVTLWNVTPGGPNITNWESYNVTTLATVNAVAVGDLDNDGDADVVTAQAVPNNSVTIYANPGSGMNITQWAVTTTASVGAVNTVAIGDFDGNGLNDIASGAGAQVSIYNNSGNLNIATWPVYNVTTASTPIFIAIGDVNGTGDGDLDVVVAIVDRITVYYNTGKNPNITQWPSANITISAGVNAVAVGDLDNDSDNDIVAGLAAAGSRITAYNNTGVTDISIWPSYNVSTDGAILSVAIGDIDNDGDVDIVSGAGVTNKLSVYNNTGTINISQWPINNATLSQFPAFFAVGDLNDDGRNDIAIGISNGGNKISIYNNSGSIDVSQWASYNVTTAGNVPAVAIGDLERDGDLDVVAAAGTRVSVYNNTDVAATYINSTTQNFPLGSKSTKNFWINWTPSQTGTANLYAIADIAGTFAEILETSNNFVAKTVSVARGSNGTSAPDIFASNITNLTFATSQKGDVNVSVDAFRINTTSGWVVNVTLRNVTVGGQNISTGTSFNATTADDAHIVATADMDNDGDNDVVAAIVSGVNRISLYNNTGNTLNIATWPVTNASVSSSTLFLDIGDIDGNGFNDVVIGYAGTIAIYNNTGNTNISSWDTFTTTAADVINGGIAIGDVDGDSDNDIVAGIGPGIVDRISVYYNPGGRRLDIATWTVNNVTTADNVNALAIADIDSDGDNDIVAGLGATADRVSVYYNPGGAESNIATWTTSNTTTVDDVKSVGLADIDNDGDIDITIIIGIAASNQLSIYNNTGGTSIATWPVANLTVVAAPNSLDIGDTDRNGLNDIVVSFIGLVDKVSIYNNTGNVNVTLWSETNVTAADDIDSVSLADMDNDGDLDIVAGITIIGDRVTIYENTNVSTTYIDSLTQNYTQNGTLVAKNYWLNWTPSQGGVTRLYEVADGSGKFAETLESNNFATKIVNVTAGTPTVTYVTPTPNNETLTQNWAYINITVSVAATSATLEWNGVNESMTQGTTNTQWFNNKTTLADANYTFNAYATVAGPSTGRAGNRWVNINTDTSNMGAVTNLRETLTGNTWILWNWTNPTQVAFCCVEISINNTLKTNGTSVTSYNFTPAIALTGYEIEVKTFASNGTGNGFANDTAQVSRCFY